MAHEALPTVTDSNRPHLATCAYIGAKKRMGSGDFVPKTAIETALPDVGEKKVDLPCSSFLARLARRAGASASEVDDVVQEALMAIWQARGDIPSEEDPTAWSRRIAASVAWNYVRRVRRRREVEMTEEIEDQRPEPARVADAVAVLRLLMGEIHPSRREIFVQHEFLGMSVGEIAEQSGIHVDTVTKRLVKGREEALAAADRWEHERRRRRWAKLFALPLSFLGGPVVKTAAAAGLVGLVSFTPHVGDRSSTMLMAQTAVGPTLLAATPSLPPPRAAEAVDVAMVTSAPALPIWVGPSRGEQELIELARTAFKVGAPLEAMKFLDDHERRFPGGALAAQRRELQRRFH